MNCILCLVFFDLLFSNYLSQPVLDFLWLELNITSHLPNSSPFGCSLKSGLELRRLLLRDWLRRSASWPTQDCVVTSFLVYFCSILWYNITWSNSSPLGCSLNSTYRIQVTVSARLATQVSVVTSAPGVISAIQHVSPASVIWPVALTQMRARVLVFVK